MQLKSLRLARAIAYAGTLRWPQLALSSPAVWTACVNALLTTRLRPRVADVDLETISEP